MTNAVSSRFDCVSLFLQELVNFRLEVETERQVVISSLSSVRMGRLSGENRRLLSCWRR